MPSKLFYSWLAGFTDGEGCYTLRKGNGIRLHITNTELKVLKEIQKKVGGTITETLNKRKYNPRNSRSWIIFWYREDCKKLTRHMLPFLKLKDSQAKLILKAPISTTGIKFSLNQGRLRDEIQREIKKLNRKGHWRGKIY